jgi:hypothetical protein
MHLRFLAVAVITLATAFVLTAGPSQDSVAANMSPAQIGQTQPSRIVEPAHCRAYRHCHRRCNRGRCWRYCHRCG